MSRKNIPNIVDCHLKGYPFLIIFGMNISGTTGHQMIIHYSTSPKVCGKQNQRYINWNEWQYVKNHAQHYRLWLWKRIDRF